MPARCVPNSLPPRPIRRAISRCWKSWRCGRSAGGRGRRSIRPTDCWSMSAGWRTCLAARGCCWPMRLSGWPHAGWRRGWRLHRPRARPGLWRITGRSGQSFRNPPLLGEVADAQRLTEGAWCNKQAPTDPPSAAHLPQRGRILALSTHSPSPRCGSIPPPCWCCGGSGSSGSASCRGWRARLWRGGSARSARPPPIPWCGSIS